MTKLIGVLQKIPLQNLAGDEVYGMYNTVYPIYQLMMAIAIAGIPTALSYYIVQKPNQEVQERILRTGLILISGAGVIFSIMLFILSPSIAYMIGDSRVIGSIQVLAIALLFTPVIAVYRGYYQGTGQAKISSISQLIEQIIRVLCMIAVLLIGIKANWSNTTIATAVMWGSSIGAIATLMWLLSRRRRQRALIPVRQQLREDIPPLIRLALPTALAAIIVPMVSVVDAFTIPKHLIFSGWDHAASMAEFGIYSRIQPLIQLVSMLLGALAAGFIPGWVKASLAHQRGETLLQQLALLHRVSFMVGAAAAIGLIVLAEPINIMLYKDAAGLNTFVLLAFTALASCLLAVQAPALQAAGLARLSYLLLIAAAISKGIFNMLLVPKYGIAGAAVAGIIALSLSAIIGAIALNMATNDSRTKTIGKFKHHIKKSIPFFVTILACFLMVLAIDIVSQFADQLFASILSERLLATSIVFAGVIVGGLVFSIIIVIFRGITKEERELIFRK